MKVVVCRGCPAEIVFLDGVAMNPATGKPKKVPVEAGTVRDGDTKFDPERHKPHWTTCPAAKAFRRARSK